jgi:hypothetical protein
MNKKEEAEAAATAATWEIIASHSRSRRRMKRIRRGEGSIFTDPITDPEHSLLFSDPIFDY